VQRPAPPVRPVSGPPRSGTVFFLRSVVLPRGPKAVRAVLGRPDASTRSRGPSSVSSVFLVLILCHDPPPHNSDRRPPSSTPSKSRHRFAGSSTFCNGSPSLVRASNSWSLLRRAVGLEMPVPLKPKAPGEPSCPGHSTRAHGPRECATGRGMVVALASKAGPHAFTPASVTIKTRGETQLRSSSRRARSASAPIHTPIHRASTIAAALS